jgi:DNA-binding GntR family transcriptional regulator
MAGEEPKAEPFQLTLQAAAQIRGLIIDRVLLPGEKIRQVELAERIGVSRSPLREALRTLESEGVVTYEINRGYVVARLDDEDLAQLFRMRSMLEGELLLTIGRAKPEALANLRTLNDQMMTAIDDGNMGEILRYNREFHFAIFDLSPLKQFRREVRRLWQLSERNSAAWWWRMPEARSRINAEHKAIIAALRKYDVARVVELCEEHRVGGFERSVTGSGPIRTTV